jgi:hypothetical protein
MPWCEDCSRFYNPNSLRPDGTCPTCGLLVGEPGAQPVETSLPWHFKLLVLCLVIYLGWRFVQLIGWIIS